jgi:hypothetical protein
VKSLTRLGSGLGIVSTRSPSPPPGLSDPPIKIKPIYTILMVDDSALNRKLLGKGLVKGYVSGDRMRGGIVRFSGWG